MGAGRRKRVDYTFQNNSLGGRTSQHLGKEEIGLAKTQSGKAVTEQGTQEKRQFS